MLKNGEFFYRLEIKNPAVNEAALAETFPTAGPLVLHRKLEQSI